MNTPLTALVLSGGGARAAYQVGVLKALNCLRRDALGSAGARGNPFDIFIGTSAGAINSAALACRADAFDDAVGLLCQVWSNFHAEQVYRTDSLGAIFSGTQWLTVLSLGWVLARSQRVKPRSLLNNAPLAELVRRLVPMERLPEMLAAGHLHALALTASSYSTGEHVTFYHAREAIKPWMRTQRHGVPSQLNHDHLLASSAIPFIFPACHIQHDDYGGWYGDGSMRQSAPLAPAVHLGAQRLLVIGAGRMHEPAIKRASDPHYPSVAHIAGHALSSIFLDALAVDIERMARINHTLSLLPPSALADTPLRPVDFLVIAPSQRLDDIAARHLDALAGPVRGLLRGAGVGKAGLQVQGSALASYLLFEAPYTRELMALGEADTLARKDEVNRFFGWVNAPAVAPFNAEFVCKESEARDRAHYS